MADEFRVHIVASDRDFFDGACTSIRVPTVDGAVGLMAHHIDIVTALVPGEMWYRLPDGTENTAAVSHGLLRMEDNDVLILVDSAEYPEEIDMVRAKRAAERAKEIMLQSKSWQEYLQTQASLSRAMNRLKAAHRANSQEFD
ncbi:MAG: ATP synthase F1 subunit epsilon [Oscillospiraceae bacterium]|nr:ATP synthase F1 subunit epsilon [Oscillospiraceae bacterium]